MNDSPAMNDFIQAGRLLRIETPLGADAFLMESFAGREAVNELFTFEAVVRAKRDDVKAQDLVGKNVEVSLDRGDEGPRRVWNGLVVGMTEEPRLTRALRQYVLTLRPVLWLLSQRSDCRIWQNKTSVEIAETLLSEHGLHAPDVSGVLNPPAAQEYSIQWNETDLAFLLRRLEEDGLYYWVRQADGAQIVAIADNASAWDDGHDGDVGRVRFASGSTDRDHINAWTRRFAFVPGKRAGRDWNFETPTMTPGSDTPSLVKLPRNGSYELYEYPARALDLGASETAMKLRMQSVEADHERVEGASTTRTLAPGAKVTPHDVAHPDHTFETSVITAIEHYARDTTYETGSDHPIYQNRFEASPARLPLTPHRRTPRPRIDGTQIAIVAGPEGEEIHTEQYGRIKLWFPWDRRAKKDGSDTKWVRVSQSWGGGQWGQQIIPRIGMEVAVSYLDGDPDRPLVVGVVPNPVNSVPYDLPANKTRMVLRSNTHKGAGFNEVSFEDESGQQNMFFHAEKDQTTRVLNNRAKRVDAHEIESIGQNKSVDIGGSQQERIAGSRDVSVGGGGGGLIGVLGGILAAGGRDAQNGSAAISDALLGQFTATVAAAAALREPAALAANAAFAAAGNHRTAGGGESAGAGSAVGGLLGRLMPISGVLTSMIEKFRSDTIGIGRTEQIGVYKNTSVGHTMTINVGEEFIIKVGQSKLMMDKEGNVTITGTKFNFAATGHVQINGKVIDLN